MQKYLSIFVLIHFFFSSVLADKPKILVSTVPIAGIVEMITGNEFTVEAINIPNGCPHHYNAKPSDKAKLESADIAIYIDDSFDSFFMNLLRNYRGKVIKISDLSNLSVTKDGKVNWHFWLDLNKVQYLMNNLAQKLMVYYPEKTESIQKNLTLSKQKLQELSQDGLTKKLINLPEIILLTSSAEHFFIGNNIQYQALFKSSYSSLQFARKLEDLIVQGKHRCFAIAPDQYELSKYQESKNFVIINAENWQIEKNVNNYAELYYSSYKKIIDGIVNCSFSSK